MALDPLPVVPGYSLGFISLGSALQEVLSTIKADKERFPTIDLHFSQTTPLTTPIVVTLPQNGIRLRFDGKDQRLRLIEVIDFSRVRLAYKGSELLKKPEEGSTANFRRIYQLFGASYPGEYVSPKSGQTGIYALSWPGIAFNFPLLDSAYALEKDHVSLLGSQAASPATGMAIFEGNSWPEVRNDLFVKTPSKPRAAAIVTQPRDILAPEIEMAYVGEPGRLTLIRRAPSPSFDIVTGRTTPQDLLTELGPPEAVHKRDTQAIIDQLETPPQRGTSKPTSNGRAHPTPPSSYSSTGTDTFDVDFDSGDAEDDATERAGRETFWCYFCHGMDILLGPPSDLTSSSDLQAQKISATSASSRLVVLKVIMHGNVPGSYAFNRHRRLRWTIELPSASAILDSEHRFEEIKADLMQAFANVWSESEMGRGKVVNRTWGAGPSDSSFFLPDADQELVEGGGSEQWLGNTQLYSFPGLTFEVLKNGAICALTVS